MDKKLLLIKATTLLYRESQLEGTSENSAELVRSLLEGITLPEISAGMIDSERDQLAALKTICLEMCANGSQHKYEPVELMLKIRHAVRDEDSLYDSFKLGIETELEQNRIKLMCLNLKADIAAHISENEIQKIIQDAAYKLKVKRDTIPNVRDFISKVAADLEPFQKTGPTEDPAIVSSIVLSNKDQVANVMSAGSELNNDAGIMKTGFQGLNRMMQGGFRRGETWVMSALQHNAKTLFSLTLFKQIALYNKPYMIDPKKKPLLLRISFEDPLELNIPYLYRNIYENKTKMPVDMRDLEDPSRCAEYVFGEMGVNGYEIMMLHVNPILWTYRNICNKVLELEAMGYEVHMLALDYLAMVPTTGCNTLGPTGSDKRDLFRRMRNFCSARKTTLFTPHQMSTEAKMLIRQGLEADFVNEVANKGYYDGCRTIDQEVDGELYIHIVEEDSAKWLTIRRGKHRLTKQTPMKDLYATLKFQEVGDLPDDIMGEDTTYRKPGGTLVSSANARSHFDFSI